MSTNCLVTKLKDSVANPSLLKIDEIKFRIPANTNIDTYVNYYGTEPLNMRIISGTGSFSDAATVTEKSVPISWDEESATIGVYKFTFYSTTECEIAIDRRYKIKQFIRSTTGNIYINSDDLRVLSNNNFLNEWCNGVDGNLNMSLLPSSIVISVNGGFIRGKGLYGDITHLLANISLLYPEFFIVNSVTADICNIPNFQKPILYGAKVPLSWKGTRNPDYKVICLAYNAIDFGTDLDNMLINQANCQSPTITDTNLLYIIANGTKTSASDAAVATLKGMGLTVVINGETL